MSEALLTPMPNYQLMRPARAKDHHPVPHRWFAVLAMHLSGKSPKEIQKETGYSQAMYYRILSNPEVLAVRQQLLAQTQMEFEALYSKVVDNLREQLNSKDPEIQLAAQQQFFKATGKYAPKPSDPKGEQLSAEDLVTKLLQQQINIQVNVGGQPATPTQLIEAEVVDVK